MVEKFMEPTRYERAALTETPPPPEHKIGEVVIITNIESLLVGELGVISDVTRMEYVKRSGDPRFWLYTVVFLNGFNEVFWTEEMSII